MAKQRKRRTTRKKKKRTGFRKGKIFGLIIVVLGIVLFFVKDLPVDYYHDTGKGLNGAALKSAVHDQIRRHKYLDFEQNTTARYWWDNYFTRTDRHPDGYFWDMYSKERNKNYIGGSAQAREHCMPRSWWGVRDKYPSYDANGDLHNIFPSDYQANQAKSNLSLGEVGTAKFDNGVSKVGNNTYPKGHRGQVFEPADEYKGDFARVYFYMVTCYEDYAYNWRGGATSTMLQKGAYPSFQPWAIEMLLEWHRRDPVSEKEIKRNTEVFRIQGNRNPFVDYPELAEHIWGSKVNEPFDSIKDNKTTGSPQLKDQVWSYIYEVEKIVRKWIDHLKYIF